MKPILLHRPLALSEMLTITAGALHFSTVSEPVFSKIATDTREDVNQSLFVAIRGENFDAHTFLPQVKSHGAQGVMVENLTHCPPDLPAIVVPNTKIALGQLAHFVREQWAGKVVGITGSNGKTTTKEMLFAILKVAYGKQQVSATKGNLNNDLGVPFTLLPLGEQKIVVVEMGMNHETEMAYLSKLACPDVVLITNAHRAHLGGLLSLENIAREKGEICAGLKPDGVAILPKDSPFLELWRQSAKEKKVVTFALNDESADFSAHLSMQGNAFCLGFKEGRIPLRVLGQHNAQNALAAAAAAWVLGVDFASIQQALSAFEAPLGRLCVRQSVLANLQLIDDTYNANPESMAAAIDVLSTLNGKKILVLGDMGELGDNAQALHAEIGKKAKLKGVDALYTLGEFSRFCAQAFGKEAQHFEDENRLIQKIKAEKEKAVVLIKGSRFMKMERIVHALEQSCY